MSDTPRRGVSVQDTRHPVFDATVNIIMNLNGVLGDLDVIPAVHKIMLELYEKEPGRQSKTVTKTAQEWADAAKR